ncbi:TadE/TadG family type IV pilus assembly protein [Herbaspirillum sp. SJZ107]|uniref:TadE/TadG family type IV pilus assembly protein n=1 Tax=Herbaspirillum sp. SJZ107 TaxID=2572881 RepID=UPI00114F6947|nr:TadE family protein [Herbaspirillum sp. SJZ107]TQK11320.1 TadE-like protein [Herbaspirillum sp. SJZ107]
MKKPTIRRPVRHAESGVAAVEFALVAILFFIVVFGILEIARIMYMYNTLANVTRSAARAAANIDWRSTADLDLAKQHAMLRASPGELPFGAPVTDRHIRIDYIYLKQGATTTYEPIPAASMPGSPGRNRQNCLTNPYGSATSPSNTCIRMVRARICKPDSDCAPVNYQMLIPLLNLGVTLPTSTTIVSAETLGYHAGDPVSP